MTPRSSPAIEPLEHRILFHAGDLDPSFDAPSTIAGTATADFAGQIDMAKAVVVQSDGKAVVAGYSFSYANSESYRHAHVSIARFNPDGSPDTTFGAAGQTSLNFQGSNWLLGLTLQKDGKILIAADAGNGDFGLARLMPDGSPDPSFGTGGNVVTDAGDAWFGATSVAVEPDGKIFAAGGYGAVARYNADGSPDATFDGDGIAHVASPALAAGVFSTYAMALQADGRILAAGYYYLPSFNPTKSLAEFALARLNSDGSMDGSFGAGGVVLTRVGKTRHSEINALAVQPDGKIIATGLTSNNEDSLAIARYNPDGSLDKKFGKKGSVTDRALAGAFAVSLQSDGRIVAAGSAATSPRRFAAARYLPTGQRDRTFGDGGVAAIDVTGDAAARSPSRRPLYPAQQARFLAILPDGRLLLAGELSDGNSWASGDNNHRVDFLVARLQA